MQIPVLDVIAGTTLRLTWVNTGTTPTSLLMNILDRNEGMVSSVNPVASGDGHYYAPLYVPTSYRWYVGQAIAVIDTRTYVNRVLIRTHQLQVD